MQDSQRRGEYLCDGQVTALCTWENAMSVYSNLRSASQYSRFALVALLSLFLGSQMAMASLPKIIGSGIESTDVRKVSSFHKIKVSGAIDVTMTYGKESAVTVSAADNIVALVRTDVNSNGTLNIGMEPGTMTKTKLPIRVMVTSPELKSAKVSGTSQLGIEDFELNELRLKLDGASKLSVDSKVDHLDIDVSGASLLTADNAAAKTIELEVSGAAKATVAASKSIEGKVTGEGTVVYGGVAKAIAIESSATSKVTRVKVTRVQK